MNTELKCHFSPEDTLNESFHSHDSFIRVVLAFMQANESIFVVFECAFEYVEYLNLIRINICRRYRLFVRYVTGLNDES